MVAFCQSFIKVMMMMMMGNWGQFIYLTDVNYRYLQLDRFYLLATGMASREVTKAIL